MRKHVWKKILPITLAVAIFATSIPMDAYANTVSQNTVGQEEEVHTDEPMVMSLEAQAEDAVSGLLDGTTIFIEEATLKATYKEEGTATSTIINMQDGGNYEFPYNADINMRLDFVIAQGNAIGAGKYVYQLPTSVRVDVEATHELEDGTGRSIGKVHIAQDGTLTFQFYTDVIKDNNNINFYVQFDGGLSESLQESGKEANISFPTADGGFDISIKTTDSTEKVVDPEPKDVSISKYGAQIVEDGTGKKMIEWTVELGPEGRDTLDGTIIDRLADGLTYVPGSAKLNDAYEGTITESVDGQNLKIELKDVKAWYHAKVTFRTTYDETVFGTNITNSTSQLINNEAVFNPTDGTPGVTDDSKVQIRPAVVEKADSVVNADNTITWTVVLNREKLDIQGTTFQDTIGEGMELVENSFSGLPNGMTPIINEHGFTLSFPSNGAVNETYTITYKTRVTDVTMQSYQNKAELKDGTNVTYNVSDVGTTPGLNLLDKSFVNFNSVTNTFTWNIVINASEKELHNVVVEDTIPDTMEFVSASVEPTKKEENNAGGTDVAFTLGDITKKTTITIVTRVKDPTTYQESTAYRFFNDATLKSTDINTDITDRAETWTQIKKPELGSKKGQIKDGVIEWTITVNQPQLTVEGIQIEDILPADTEYIPGTFHIQNMYYDAAPLYREPSVGSSADGKQTIQYTFNPADEKEKEFYQKGFWIVYRTRVTDRKVAAAETAYENAAKLSVTYEGDIEVDDDLSSTVKGTVGGVIDKSYSYRSGNAYVDWTVDINEGRNDMSDIKNAKIVDELADYFDYVSGTLYLVKADGTETEVAKADYRISVVNGKLILQLPKDENGAYLNDNCYRFKFRTRFNVLAAELEGKKITNTVSFEGSGDVYTSQTDSIKNVSFSSSSAGAVIKREIRVKKVDSVSKQALAGAKFELYLGTECVGEAISGADGYAVFEDLNSITGYTVELKEIQAPDGYQLPADAVTEIEFTEANLKSDGGVEYYAIEIPNTAKVTEYTGDIQIEKKDVNGVLLSGAEFGLYKNATCTSDDLLETRLTTNGAATFSRLSAGTYYVKEISSPAGYKLSTDVIEVTIANDGSVTYPQGATKAVFINEKSTGILQITKQNDKTTALLSGAEFSIYKDALCTDRVDTKITDGSGVLEFTGLELGRTYYYRETKAPAGYLLDSTIYSVVIGDGTEKADVTEKVVVKNTEAIGNILIHKVDNSATPVPLGGVTFGLYDATGNTPVKDEANQNYTVTTDDTGMAAFNNLPFGEYVVKEVNGKAGYKVSTTDTKVTVKTLGNTEVTIVNDKIVVDIQIMKEGEALGGGTTGVLAGAELGLYTDKGVQVAKGTTGADGKLVFHDIAYGNYYVEELKAPEGYKINSTQTMIQASQIEAAYNQTGVLGISITNELQKGSIQIKKTDDKNQDMENAEFTLYDEYMLPVRITGITNPAISDANGIAKFSNLPYGTYYIQETKAPAGYVRDTGVYKVIVTSDDTVTKYTKENGTQEDLIIVNKESEIPYVSFKLKKISDDNGKTPLANATFELYKDGKPCNPSVTAVTDANGIAYFRRVEIKDDAATTIYTVKEISAPTGYKLNPGIITLGNKNDIATFSDPKTEGSNNLTDDEILWINGSLVEMTSDQVVNTPLKGSVKITKTGLNAATVLQGAEFTLYDENKSAVTGISGLINPAVTDATGVATFTNLPVGVYYIKETKAPKGYTLNTTETKVVVTDETVHEISYKDTPINVSVSKKSLTGETELAGAALKIYKKDDIAKTAVDSWTTGTGSHRVMAGALEVNTTYVLTEMVAPNGYGYMADQEFTVNADGSITLGTGSAKKDGQTIVVRDVPVKASFSKQDENEPDKQLPGAIIGIYDEKGVEVVRFTTSTITYDIPLGTLVAPKPDANGNPTYRYYTIKELSAPAEFEVAMDMKIALKSDGTLYEAEGNGAAVTYKSLGSNPVIVMKDKKKPTGTIYIRKINDKTGVDISGATLGIYDTSDTLVTTITPTGKPVPIVCGTAGGGGVVLEFDKEYILRETKAPDGYLVASDIRFKVETSGKISIISGLADNLNGDKDTLMMRDKELELKIRKQDAYGQVLNQAVLSLSEYDALTATVGNEIVNFTSGGGTAQNILSKDLKAGESYILREVSAPDGYKKAADIIFTIQPDGSLVREDGVPVYNNTIVMEDEDAGVCIGKISLNTGNGLAGSTLELSSADDAHFTTTTWVSDGTNRTWDLLEFTPGCTYTLKEMNAPLGYAYTDPIVFTIDANDHQIYINGQKVDNRTVHIADGKLELAVDKLDFYSKENVVGAELAVYDENDNLMTSWTSGAGKIWIDTSSFIAGRDTYKEYTLREVKAPVGYKKAADIPFAIDRDGKIYLVKTDAAGNKTYDLVTDKVLTMYDVPYIRVEKLDGDGNAVTGAKLEVTAKDDASFMPITWVTNGEPYWFEDNTFKPGVTYVLKELEAPAGYSIAEEITFTVDGDGNLYVDGQLVENKRIVMLDYRMNTGTNAPGAGAGNNPGINTGIPKTGDGTPLGTLMLFAAVGFFGALMSFRGYFISRRKRKQS